MISGIMIGRDISDSMAVSRRECRPPARLAMPIAPSVPIMQEITTAHSATRTLSKSASPNPLRFSKSLPYHAVVQPVKSMGMRAVLALNE